MYFSGLRRLLGSAEQTLFYDVALLYLSAQKYRNLCMVDGPGDGGVDVTCSRSDLRIQLSVRADWEAKVNEEAHTTRERGLRHLIFVTNRKITPRAEAAFRASKYKYAGDVEVSIHDLNRITTALSRPGRIKRAYEMLGATVAPTVHASQAEIAVSSLLLFGAEAAELREEIVNANVRAWLLHHPGTPEEILIDEVVKALPGASPVKAVLSSLSRLRTSGQITGLAAALYLSDDEAEKMRGAETEFLHALAQDIRNIEALTGLTSKDAEALIKLATETLLTGADFDSGDADDEGVKLFLANHSLTRKRLKIYEALSASSMAKHFQYAKTINEIYQTNTYDIYRALGGKTDITMVLDTSVALPMLLGLEFKSVVSRYSVAATTLLEICRSHEISIVVPRPYVNEMAAHGIKAVEFLETYDALPADLKRFLRGSGNAYLSHFSHIQAATERSGQSLSLREFLAAFGLQKGTRLRQVENRILSLLESQGFSVEMTGYYDAAVRQEIVDLKPHEAKVIIDHDAAVCSQLYANSDKGYIFATWDRALIQIVQGLSKVYADSPARVSDFLSAVEGVDYDYDRSAEIFTTLLHVEDRAAEALGKKIDRIRSPQQAFKIRSLIEEARSGTSESWMPDVDDLTHFLDSSSSGENSAAVEEWFIEQD